MSSLFNLLKNLFSGILGFIGGFFGKKSGYYLELEESKADKPLPAVKPAAEAPKPTATSKAAAEKVAIEPVAKADPQPETVAAPIAKAESKPKTTPAPEPVAAAALNLPQPTVTTFAPNYLTPQTSSPRRRPGANMTSYLDMARQVKTPG